jgi:hypothetical protein
MFLTKALTGKKDYFPLYDFDINTHLNGVEICWKQDLITNEMGAVDIKIKQNKGFGGYLFYEGFSGEKALIATVLKRNNLLII